MGLTNIMQSVEVNTSQHSKGSRKSRGSTWSSYKDEIYRVYITERCTLSETMDFFEKVYGLKAWCVLCAPYEEALALLASLAS